jgi:hypothetical protein
MSKYSAYSLTQAQENYLLILQQTINKHPAIDDHPFQRQIATIKPNMLLPEEIDVFRTNILYRTSETGPFIKSLLTKVKALPERTTAILEGIEQNWLEESGQAGTPPHVDMLLEAFNALGESYKLPKVSKSELKIILSNPENFSVTPEAQAFRAAQIQLYRGGAVDQYSCASLLKALGANAAQEFAATGTLKAQWSFFKKREEAINEINFNRFKDEVFPYFDAHIPVCETADNGVEARHAEDAARGAVVACCTDEEFLLVLEGAQRFLDAQADLWNSLEREITSPTRARSNYSFSQYDQYELIAS